MELQAKFWYEEHRFEEAKSEVLSAIDTYVKAGATNDVERCRQLLRKIEEQVKGPVTSGE